MIKVVLLNAYRRSNAGDGLLVDEAAALAREAFGDVDLTLVSMAPDGFSEYPRGLHPISGAGGAITRTGLIARALTGRAHRDVMRAVAEADVALGVGGGYLRAATISGALKSYLSHVVQVPKTASSTPHVYLPQSIGPLPPAPFRRIARRLNNAQAVFVRDDRSLAELQAVGVEAKRMPDLAVLSMASSPPVPRQGTGPVGLVARALSGPDRGYRSRIIKLHDLLQSEVLVQSSGRGNDDPSFYRSLGWNRQHRPLLAALDGADAPSVVVSVRLHGSLQSILAGVPSVHLSYERKGWGAYEDLGLGEFVHHAWTFDPDLVAEQVRRLNADATPFWNSVAASVPRLSAARRLLVEDLRRIGPRTP